MFYSSTINHFAYQNPHPNMYTKESQLFFYRLTELHCPCRTSRGHDRRTYAYTATQKRPKTVEKKSKVCVLYILQLLFLPRQNIFPSRSPRFLRFSIWSIEWGLFERSWASIIPYPGHAVRPVCIGFTAGILCPLHLPPHLFSLSLIHLLVWWHRVHFGLEVKVGFLDFRWPGRKGDVLKNGDRFQRRSQFVLVLYWLCFSIVSSFFTHWGQQGREEEKSLQILLCCCHMFLTSFIVSFSLSPESFQKLTSAVIARKERRSKVSSFWLFLNSAHLCSSFSHFSPPLLLTCVSCRARTVFTLETKQSCQCLPPLKTTLAPPSCRTM